MQQQSSATAGESTVARDHPDLTAIVVSRDPEPSGLQHLMTDLRSVASDLFVVLPHLRPGGKGKVEVSQGEGEATILNGRAKIVRSVMGDDRTRPVRDGLRAALRNAPESEAFVILDSEEKPEASSADIARLADSSVDYCSKPGLTLLSRRYAAFLEKTDEPPSFTNAKQNGFIPSMSLGEMIKSPEVALKKNWTLVKFLTVGASGGIVNLVILALLKSLGLNIYLANAIALETSILNNFTWNDRFTFGYKTNSTRPRAGRAQSPLFSRLGKYNLVSLTSFAINMGVFFALTSLGIYYLTSEFVAIVVAFAVNYSGSSKWAWRRRKRQTTTERTAV